MATNLEKPDFKKQFRGMVQSAQSLTVAYIGVVNGLFAALKKLGAGDVAAIATAARMDAGYVRRWCDAAFAFGYLDAEGDVFRLSDMGAAMPPDAPDTLMPLAMTMVSSVHMSVRSAALMRNGERPAKKVMGEVYTLLPWFGTMLEGTFARFFEEKICPGVPVFSEINERGGLVVDLGCGNGWYLRALGRRCGDVRGLGLDGFEENVVQAARLAQQEGVGNRLQFVQGDAREFNSTAADLIAMNRALHHVWESGVAPFIRGSATSFALARRWRSANRIGPPTARLCESLRCAAWRCITSTSMCRAITCCTPDEIADRLRRRGLAPEIHRFAMASRPSSLPGVLRKSRLPNPWKLCPYQTGNLPTPEAGPIRVVTFGVLLPFFDPRSKAEMQGRDVAAN